MRVTEEPIAQDTPTRTGFSGSGRSTGCAQRRGEDILVSLVGGRLDRRAMLMKAIWVLRAPRDIKRGRSTSFLSARYEASDASSVGHAPREQRDTG